MISVGGGQAMDKQRIQAFADKVHDDMAGTIAAGWLDYDPAEP